MNRKKILENAIQIAINKGWNGEFNRWTGLTNARGLAESLDDIDQPSLNELIYDHDFAKALWGEEGYKEGNARTRLVTTIPAWGFHLQQMVISPDPIEYLAENLPSK